MTDRTEYVDAVVTKTTEYAVRVPLSELAQAMGTSEEDLREVIAEGNSGDFDRVCDWFAEHAEDPQYGDEVNDDMDVDADSVSTIFAP